MTLLKQQWRSERASIISWALIIGGLSWLLVYLFRALLNTNMMRDLVQMIENLPPAFKSVFGGMGVAAGGFSFLNGFIQSLLFNGIMLMIVAIYVGVTVPGLISREVDQRNMEFLLSLPVRRPVLILVRWLSLVGGLAAIGLCHWLAIAVGAGTDALPGRYLLAELNLFLVFATVGTLIMLITVFIDDHSLAMGVSVGVTLGLFLMVGVLDSKISWMAALRKLSPYTWIKADVIIGNGQTPWGTLIGLALATALLLGLTIHAFNRKQLTA